MRTPYVTGQRDVLTSTKNTSLRRPPRPRPPQALPHRPLGPADSLSSPTLYLGVQRTQILTQAQHTSRQPARESWRQATG